MKQYQIPNGDYIALEMIVGIRFLPADKNFPPRVVIDKQQQNPQVVNFDSAGKAIEFRDALARKCGVYDQSR